MGNSGFGFIVAWENDQPGGNWDVFARHYDSFGVPQGAEFPVNMFTTGRQGGARVAADAQGTFVVAWTSQGQDDPLNYGVFARRYNAVGAPVGAEFQVNTFTTGFQYVTDVASNTHGFVVVWMSHVQDGSGLGVFAQRYAYLDPVGSEFQVNTYTAGYQDRAAVAINRGGRFVVAWRGDAQDGSGSGVFAQRFDEAGARLGGEFQVNTYTTGDQDSPTVSIDREGDFVVAWSSDGQDGNDTGIYAQRFTASGDRIGSEFLVNEFTTLGQRNPKLASDEWGNFTLTWDDSGQDSSGYGAFGKRFNANGVERSPEFRINTYVTANQISPAVAADGLGRLVVAWGSDTQDGSSWGVFGQRYAGGMVASSLLEVDAAAGPSSNGNRVLEPGETVVVAPRWLNVNGTSVTFGGVAAAFTGPGAPGDPTYVIADGIANYGSVVANDRATCAATTDCYELSLGVPSARPVHHWDATLQERLTPFSLGDSTDWKLHVGNSFTDVVANSPFYRYVETLFHNGVTSGCGGTRYCPADPVTREQMAVFVLVADSRFGRAGFVPPACVTPRFADVAASSPFCPWIEELARRGVVGGCGGGNYCPGAPVSRQEMAVFVLAGSFPPPACVPPNMFADVPETNPFCRWVEDLARRNVVTGCGGGNYCPAQPVTREQMSVFITLPFRLTLYGAIGI